MNEPDARPAPRYGQYATPEEVAAALGLPAPPKPGERLDARPPAGIGTNGSAAASSRSSAPPLTGARSWDRFATIFLLLFGLANLVLGAPALLQLDATLRESLVDFPGIGDIAFGAATRWVGQGILVAHALVFTGTALLAWRRLGSGRISFWVPLVGALAAMIVVVAGVSFIPILDPVFAESTG